MKKLFWLLAVVFATPVFAQEEVDTETAFDGVYDGVVDGIVAKQHIKNKRNMVPAYVREANVLWSKTIWRIIDLREKQNLYLYYPINTTGAALDGRRSLVRTLLDAINDGELKAYSSNAENEFEQIISPREAFDKFKAEPVDSVETVNPETGEREMKYVYDMTALPLDYVKKFMVKEVWFFDNKYAMLKSRILGLCPIMVRPNDDGTRLDQSLLFWVYYPAAAPFLSKQEAFTFSNDAQRPSLYDRLEARQFGSYVYKESNVYNNRIITSYAKGMSSNIEAERIENSVFQKEHDMWEY